MIQSLATRVLLLGIVVLCCQHFVFSQSSEYPALRLRQTSRPELNISLGMTSPQGRNGVREFWLNGPSGSAEFLVQLNPVLAFGVGTDMSLLYFNVGAFSQRWPGVPLAKKQNLFVGNIYVDARCAFFPGRQTRPYVSAQLGAEFISEALYRKMIGGIRYTYYDVGGKTRLALGVATGTTIALDHNLGILLELKGTFVHHDPSISFLAQLRAGIQYKL